MRRNNNMGKGGRAGGGPLMTDHLQDLELELELLKRKRQLIQQQQNEILYRPNMGQTAYNPPRQMYEDRYDAPPRRNFSHLYAASPRDVRPLAPKRRPMPVWDNEPEFGGPLVPNKRPRPNPFPTNHLMDNKPSFQPPSLLGPKPLMNFAHVPQKGQAPRPRTFQTNFKRNVKPPGPNKPNLSPKKQTPNKRVPNKPSSAPTAPKEKESFILTADVKHRSKIAGRLEFALGAILKEMKAAYITEEHKALFASPTLLRVIKHAIRERLRTLMLGKFVGAGPVVHAEYRKAFPPSTDADILKLAEVEKEDQDQKGQIAIQLLEEGDPELYFKKNVTKLLEVKLDEMFRKIEKSYENVPENSEAVENLPEVKKAPTEESLKADAEATTRNVTTKKHPKEEEYDKWMSLLVERRLPELLAKHKQDIIKVLDLDESFRATKAAIVMKTNNKSLRIAMTEHINSTKMPESNKDDPDLPKNLSYFAKVHASPLMPKRKLMQDFLNQFSPKTIKRHKKNFNLLFVGFDNKEDYDKILKTGQIKLDGSTITVVGNAPRADQSSVIEIKDDSDALDEVLTPQLDDQINDLLSSIRKADEEAKESVGPNGEAITDDASTEENGAEKEEAEKEVTNGNDDDVQEVKAEAEVVAVEDDEVAPLKSEEDAPATPAKSKAPATPSTIRTRRASRLAQNN